MAEFQHNLGELIQEYDNGIYLKSYVNVELGRKNNTS